MLDETRNNLLNLSKEQLISIIDNWKHIDFLIDCVLVEESKWHISSSEAIRQIREYLRRKKYDSLDDEHLGDLIDCDNGVISVEEYRRRVGLDE